ncbi:hypothetical protein [Streptomyces sp. NPDC088794]|uniref:hypothetical protein n=1 Tax=Streptomyces sp. NPDC088794 TaxID=3365902 RepID=UPI0038173486
MAEQKLPALLVLEERGESRAAWQSRSVCCSSTTAASAGSSTTSAGTRILIGC